MTADRARRAYTVEEIAGIVDLTEAALSFDGVEIAFVSDVTGAHELWTARLEHGHAAWGAETARLAGPPTQRTSLGEWVQDVVWSPRGDLAFVADHGGDERHDLWILRAGAAEPELIAESDVAEMQPRFSPDGTRLAYVADPDRPFRFDVQVRDLATGETRRVTSEPGSVLAPRWSPDGRTLAATATPDLQHGDLALIDVATGAVRRVAPPVRGGIVWPAAFLPSGALLARATNADGFLQMCLIDPATGGERFVGPDAWDVEDVAVARAAGVAAFVRNARGRSEVWTLDVAAGSTDAPAARRLESIETRGTIRRISIDRDGRTLLVTRTSAGRPPEVLLADLRVDSVSVVVPGSAPTDVSGLAQARLFTTPSFDGVPIDAWVLVPPVARLGSPPPAVVQVHGGPSFQARDALDPERQVLAEAGFVVVTPNYRGSTGYGRPFEDLNNHDWGGGDLRDLLAVVDALAAEGELDPARVSILGASYGGYMVLRALTETPDRWAAGAESYGMPDLAEDYRLTEDRFGLWYRTEMGTPETHPELFRERSPIHFLDRVRAPLLVLQGANDTNVPQAESDAVVAALRARGCTVEYVVYPDEGHGFTRRANRIDAMRRTVAFLKANG